MAHARNSPSKAFRVGIRWPSWANGFAHRLFEGLLDFQRTDQAFELVFNQPSGGELAESPVDAAWQGDGLIVFRYSAAEAMAWKKRGIAVVNLSSEFPADGHRFPQVTPDPQAAARLVTEHFHSLGLKDYAFIHEPTRQYSFERRDSFQHEIRKVGGRYHEISLPVSSWSEADRPGQLHAGLLAALPNLPRPCGLFAKDDIMAYAALRALKELEIACPDEISLIGFGDDIVYCHTTWPALTSVAYPGRVIGFEAARLLHQMMSDRKFVPPQRFLVPTERLAARESTGRIVFPDAALNRALEMIRRMEPAEPLLVEMLAQRVGVSREILRQRFQEYLGRSPRQEIERVRIGHIQTLLSQERWPLAVVAERTGFNGSDELCRFVKRLTGKTAGQLRRE